MSEKNEGVAAAAARSLFAYNLPVQVWPTDDEDEDDAERVLLYMPRKERCVSLTMAELLEDGLTREDLLNASAYWLENLAKLMRRAAADPKFTVYYHDANPEAQGDD